MPRGEVYMTACWRPENGLYHGREAVAPEAPGQTCPRRRPVFHPELPFTLTKVQACQEGFLVLD